MFTCISFQIDMPPHEGNNGALSKMELDVLHFQKNLTAKKGLTALKIPTVHYDPNSSQENVNPTLSAVSEDCHFQLKENKHLQTESAFGNSPSS